MDGAFDCRIAATALQQHPAYADALRSLGHSVGRVGLHAGRRRIGTMQVIERRFPLIGRIAYGARGPVWTAEADDVTRRGALATLAGQRRPIVIDAEAPSDAKALAAAGFFRLSRGQPLARLDLSMPHELRRACLHQKWRNRLVKAESHKLKLHHGPMSADPDHWVIKGNARHRKTVGYRALPDALLLALAAQAPDRVQLFSAFHEGRPCAGMVFVRHGVTASYYLGWSGEVGRRLSAHNLLLWEASCWLADHGHIWLDLRVCPANSGLARFKLGTGASSCTLGGTWISSPLTRPFRRRPGSSDRGA
ncbi:GNAT family N-acetyltransferase [Aestuariibius sp. 2305UL40-4]|uniref:GNAT family N-acetyltransferase n=1 Tax=Aestuariibius violaceus TaxID=3234132 RepID=UPI00345E70EE